MLSLFGLYLLAVGALLGWPVALSKVRPDLVERVGVVDAKAILRMHLDFVIMGALVVAVGTAAPSLPTWIAVILAIGTTTNPLLFLPQAFSTDVVTHRWYAVVSVLSFLAVTIALVSVAVWATISR